MLYVMRIAWIAYHASDLKKPQGGELRNTCIDRRDVVLIAWLSQMFMAFFEFHSCASFYVSAIWQGSFVWREHYDASPRCYFHLLQPGLNHIPARTLFCETY